ncbi:peptidylprolyl isomerase [Altererythrobacter lutimaris]|uniref:Peptidylprolyl isomerase n=1 Tax=Altererythrobacter lutimaris TaxID=2743979 RepID=A0A850HFE0_9SPHN|nr:peptidylprolyl isomerase [Altererythrobacter lutimaris]NVE95991.1 peptidylprolyl isomerase [Altererythrobacter lutimaris]
MKAYVLTAAALCALIPPVHAQEAEAPAPSPNQIVDDAAPEEWVTIPTEELMVMTLAPDAEGNLREVIIQLMPPPFSQGWVHNIKLLARSGWYDGISVNRVQDNYVVQWGDPNYDNPESDGAKKVLPEGLKVMEEENYGAAFSITLRMPRNSPTELLQTPPFVRIKNDKTYGETALSMGWPVGVVDVNRRRGSLRAAEGRLFPVHCYGMVGVGRNYSPDTGSGAELYTVIGHAPRHLDRNIALVGRIIEGMEHLSSLPRGKGTLGFYADFEKDKRTPILSIDVAADLPEGEQPAFEYLSTESETFARYAEARANRRDPFFIVPAGGADICNIPVPVRRVASD